jgi:membrane protein
MKAPDGPTDLKRESWTAALKRTWSEFREDNMSDWAAALTYYSVLAIFPALLAVVSVLGLIGPSATQPLIDNINTLAPGPAKDLLVSSIRNIQHSSGAAGVLFVVSIALAIWSASGYVAAFMRASNVIYDVGEGRPIWKTLPTRVLTTLALLVMLALVAVGVTVTGSVASSVGQSLGVGDTAVTVWGIAKWPVVVLVVMAMFGLLYWAAPNVKHPRFRWVTPGSIAGVVLWIVASVLFAVYVGNFSSYNKTYGALGGVIVFLIWLWISNIALLLGAELNAETERGRELEEGVPGAEEEIQAPYRRTPDEEEESAQLSGARRR